MREKECFFQDKNPDLSCGQIHQDIVQMSVSEPDNVANHGHDSRGSGVTLSDVPPLIGSCAWAPNLSAKGQNFILKVKSKFSSISLVFVPIKGRVQCFDSLHSKIYEYLWSHDAGKVWHREDYILHKLPIYYECMCLCWVSTLFGMICHLFSTCNKNSTTWFRSLYKSLPVLHRFHNLSSCTHRNTIKRSNEICLL